MAIDVSKKILQLQVDTEKLVNEIKRLQAEGGDAQKTLEELASKFNDAIKESVKLSQLANSALSNEKKIKVLKDVNSVISKIVTSQNTLNESVRKSNKAYTDGLKDVIEEEKRLRKLQEEIALKNIQLSEKTNVEKLQDVVRYYDGVQKEYKVDSEEYLKYEKKKLDAQIKLKNASDDERLKKRKAQLEQAVKDEKAKEQRIAKQQKALRDKIAEGNKARTKKVTDFFASQEKRRADFFERKEKEKTAKLVAEEKKRTKAVEAEAKKRDFRGGFTAQFTPRAIGGALGSLTKYLGLYQAINAAQRLFTELTIGSVKQSIEFEKSLANLGAVAGATADEVQMLGKNALEVAGATKFTAQEIVGLQTELSKLGFSADDVVSSTQAIAFTAQALGSPLAATAEQVGKVVNQFDLLIEQAEFVGDVLVTSINNSALSFDSFGTAIQYVGPIAKNLGLTFEQTAGAMAVLADNGFTASRIGTGLRGIFTELGKTSADVEKSLKSLAEENISLSEAVDLVGKRNAAQLITLLKNIDALNEGTGEYYEQGRALSSAAKQADTFSGQMEILTSNFREFQIEVGKSIVQSDLLLDILDAFFPKGAKTARAFKVINEIGFENFNKGAQNVIDGATATSEALRLLGMSSEEYGKAVEIAATSSDSFFGRIKDFAKSPALFLWYAKGRDEAIATRSTVQGLIDDLNELAESNRRDGIIKRGQTYANELYGDSVSDLIDKSLKGINVNKESDALYKELGDTIDSYTKILNSGTVEETDAFGIKSSLVELSEDQKLEYESLIKVLKGYQEQVTNTSTAEEELRKQREKSNREAQNRFKEELSEYIKRIKETEKVIEELSVSLSEDAFPTQIDLLNGFFGEAQEIINEAKRRFGPNSEIVKELVKTLKKTAEDISVALPKEAGDTIDLPVKTININPESVSLDLKDAQEFEVPPTLLDNVKEAFKDLDWGEVIVDAVNTATEAVGQFNDVALENTRSRAEQELDIIQNRYQIEQDILKSQLDNQIITESQFRQKQIELRKAQVAEENSVEKKIFDAEKKRDRQNAGTDYLESLASIIPNLIINDKEANPLALQIKSAITAALATAAYGAELSAIGQRQFFPKKFEKGGMVSGPSHADGGVPFTVQGQAGYEMEGGEFIVNKRATAMHRDLLERINGTFNTSAISSTRRFNNGGLVQNQVLSPNISLVNNQEPTKVVIEKESDESVDYLKAIAEATTSTAIGVSKPVRAYVSDKDLRGNATERRIRDRNDRI